ncbi:hypothetical protein LCGC14_0702990, partial [marine sediment metagenome]
MALRTTAGRGVIDLTLNTVGLSRGANRVAAVLRTTLVVAASAATAGLAAVAAAAVKATKAFAGFEQSMARVKALTGAVGGQFESLTRTATQLGKCSLTFLQVSFTVEELNDRTCFLEHQLENVTMVNLLNEDHHRSRSIQSLPNNHLVPRRVHDDTYIIA